MPKQPFVPVLQCIRIKYAGIHQSTPWVNLFTIQYSGSRPAQADLDAFAATMRGEWLSYWGGLLSNTTTLETTTVWDLTDNNGTVAINSLPANGQVGTVSNPPSNAAVAVSWPYPQKWRGGHFRSYIIARDMAAISGGRTLSNSEIQAYQGAAANFRTGVNSLPLTGGTVTLGGIRYFPTGVGVVKTSGNFRPFGVPVVHSRLDSQRRRLGKESV